MTQERRKIKILYIIGGIMKYGGIEAYIMNYYRHLDKEKLQIDFVVHGDGVGAFDHEITNNGGKIYHVPVKSKNFIGNIVELRRIMNNSDYDIVHVHMDGMNAIPLKIAKDTGIKVRISHSHNTGCVTQNKIKVFLNEKAKTKIAKYATHLWGCSKEACEWLYGTSEKYEIIPNAIEVDKFIFNQAKREELKKQLGLEDKIIIGHIGRMEYQKNHEFLLKIVAKLKEKVDNIILVCIGTGSLEMKIKDQIKELGIEDNVILLGIRNDVAELNNMFDLFLLPSRFEGLPVVAIEEQSNGLWCLLSNNITKEVNITGKCKFLSVDSGTDSWVSECVKLLNEERSITKEYIRVAGYDICEAAQKLQARYIKDSIKN